MTSRSTPALPPLAHLVIAASMALLLLTIIGSLLGIVVWPLLHLVYQRANSALAVVTVGVDCVAGMLSFWIFGKLSGAAEGAQTSTARTLLYRNRALFSTARFASLVCLLQLGARREE